MLELLVVDGPNRGARYTLGPGTSVVGRAAGCEVLLPDDGASRRHAQLDVRGDEVSVTDLGSQNGTHVNGIPLEGTMTVRAGARIHVAGTVLLVAEAELAAEAPRLRSTVVVKAWPRERALEEPEPARVLDFIVETARSGVATGADLRRALLAAQGLAGGIRASLYAKSGRGISLLATTGEEESAPDQAVAALESSEEPRALPLQGDELAMTWAPSPAPPSAAPSPALPRKREREEGRGGALLVVKAGPGGLAVRAWTQVFWAGIAPHAVALAERAALRREAQKARAREGPSVEIVARSAPMKRLLQQVAKAATADAPVLVIGESGSGKELVARALHDASPRASGPFVAVNAAAFPDQLLESELFGHVRGAFTGAVALKKGHFELAAGGTLFLDEIGELSEAAQKKLLRVLETREFYRLGSGDPLKTDARLIAATHRDLATLARDGKFREDLYFRLAVVELRVPPLRERGEDRALLVEALSKQLAGKVVELEPAAREKLMSYPFPGNVRELRNALERALILGDRKTIKLDDLPDRLKTAVRSSGGDLEEVEKKKIVEVLEACGWNRTKAAEQLGIDRRTLYNKLKKWGLSAGAEPE